MGVIQIPFGIHGAVVTRIAPEGDPQHYKTYGVSMPLKSHWRDATCAEVECKAYQNGWATTVDTTTELGRKQEFYIRHESCRGFTEEKIGDTLVKFTFAPGQRCFGSKQHKLPLPRPARYTVMPGDFRARTGDTRVHKRPEDWVEDFAGHQDRILTRLGRG